MIGVIISIFVNAVSCTTAVIATLISQRDESEISKVVVYDQILLWLYYIKDDYWILKCCCTNTNYVSWLLLLYGVACILYIMWRWLRLYWVYACVWDFLFLQRSNWLQYEWFGFILAPFVFCFVVLFRFKLVKKLVEKWVKKWVDSESTVSHTLINVSPYVVSF